LFWNPPTLFRMDASGNLTTLRTFTLAEGFDLSGPLVEGADGSLYGTMHRGGLFGGGTVFKVTTSGAFSLLHTFDGSDGQGPSGGLTRARDGRLFGVTSYGGEFGNGTLFRLEATGGVTTLHTFEGSEGFPAAVLEGRDGALYGVAWRDHFRSRFHFFRFTTTTGLTIVYAPVPDDGTGASRLIEGSDGAFYGTVSGIDSSCCPGGGVFRLSVPPVP
jgi:uncharacterized repeat protein (TIGR03803 family)